MHEQKTVLLIDDDREIVRGVGMRMRAAGLRVISANDGQQGLEQAVLEIPDVIVLDIRMPVMDGWTVLARLRENPKTAAIPVIVLSASVQNQPDSRALGLGARYFFQKPYHAKLLVETVKELVYGGIDLSSPRTGC